MYFCFAPQDPLTTCRSERCVATLWCCCGDHQCTRAAIRSTGSTSTSRRRRRQRRRGEESTPRLRRRRTSRSPHQAEKVDYTHVTAAVIWFSFIFQIKNLKEAETYVFRVRAQNKAGVGKTSDVTEPVPALTKPGEKTGNSW